MNDRARATSDRLHERARAFVRAFEAGAPMPEPFDALGCDIARFQAERVPTYARLCAARGVDAAAIRAVAEAPAVPTDVFKMASVFAFGAADAVATFRTSGTTQDSRGAHAMRTTVTYDAAAAAFARWALVEGMPSPLTVLALAPPPSEAPDSSLGHMMAELARRFGSAGDVEGSFFLGGGVIDMIGLDERVARLLVEERGSVLLLATSFALVHLLEGMDEVTFRLPPGSRVMQTGGFKGRSREVPAAELRAEISRVFCIEERDVVCEYGMTELSSQFYETTARGSARHGVYAEPPWARVDPVDPVTLEPVPPGEVGIARITDLMNVDSAVCLLSADRVRRVDGGFELLGRTPGAPPRGCSIAIDEMLGGR